MSEIASVRRHGDGCSCTKCVGFQRDNLAAGKHLAYACEARLSENPRVLARFEWILSTQPVSHPADEGAAWRLALTYERIDRSAAALDHVDRELADAPLGAYRDGAEFLGRLRQDHQAWLRLASKLEEELGRTPASRAKLALHVAQGAAVREHLLERYGGSREAA